MSARLLAIFLFAYGWVALLPFYDAPDSRWMALGGGGVLALLWAERREGHRWRASVGRALGGAVVVSSVQALAVGMFWEWGHQWHAMPSLGWFVFPVIKLVVPDAAWLGGTITLADGDYLYDFIPSFEILAGLVAVLLLCGAAFLLRASVRGWIYAGAGAFAYLIVRTSILYLFSVRAENTDLIWKHEMSFLSLLPLVPICAATLHRARTRPLFAIGTSRAAVGLAMVAVACVTFGGSFLRLYDEPGERKTGRVLVDEGHSDWERTDVPLNRTDYGEGTVYNFYGFYELLDLYYQMERTEERLTPELLSGADVLVLKTPTRAYDPEEIDAIDTFVRTGGGLVMIGDHTNVFGMSTYLNSVGERFGMRFVADATYGLGTMALSYYEPPPLARHPILEDLAFFSFATSCSLELDAACRSFMTGYRLLSLMADYSQRSFFTEPIPQRDYTFGLFSQGATRRVGRGRVVSFTDSTNFSNFFMFIRGKPELAIGMIEWANRSNRIDAWRVLGWSLLTLGLCAVTVLAIRCPPGRGPGTVMVAVALIMGLGAGVALSGALNRGAADSPRPRPHVRVEVLAEGRYALPERDPAEFSPHPAHDTFYTWIARTGAFPSVVDRIGQGDHPASAVVWLRPDLPLSSTVVSEVKAYLEQGGRVLVLGNERECLVVEDGLGLLREDADEPSMATALVVAQPPGSNRDLAGSAYHDIPRVIIPGVDDSVEVAASIQTIIRTLQALEDTGDGELDTASAYERRLGPGQVLFFQESALFSNGFMGSTGVVPDALQRAIFALQFALIDRVAGTSPERHDHAEVVP